MDDIEQPKNIFDKSEYKEILIKNSESIKDELGRIFNKQDREKICRDKNLTHLFFAAGLLRTSPQHLLSGLDIDKWAILVDQNIITKKEANIIAYEACGGNCPKCGKAWKKIETRYIDYFQPACICYPRCMICNRWLVVEKALKEEKCRHCGYLPCPLWKQENIFDKSGKQIGVKKYKCGGRLLLIDAMNGYTVYQCDECQQNIKQMIIY